MTRVSCSVSIFSFFLSLACVLRILQVQLTIRTLPELPLGAKYKCVFGDAEPIDATVTATGLSCPTPDLQSRPTIPQLPSSPFSSSSLLISGGSSSSSSGSSVGTGATSLASRNVVTDHVLVPLSVRNTLCTLFFSSLSLSFMSHSDLLAKPRRWHVTPQLGESIESAPSLFSFVSLLCVCPV